MDQQILARLRRITDEETAILSGRNEVDWELYARCSTHTVSTQKLLAKDTVIDVRPHTRFIHFPAHTHDYVEAIYTCEGSTSHIINGNTVQLKAGELLFINQNATHEVCRAEQSDVAVNFIMLPEAFNLALSTLGEEETPLKRFLIDCLCGQNTGPGYLHFRVSEVQSIQTLLENLLWIAIEDTQLKQQISQMTIALLLIQLMNHTETLASDDQEQAVVWKLLQYVETNYATCTLTEAANVLHCNISWLSREVKRMTGKNYTELVQEKRLAQAAYLLKNTSRTVSDISAAVGYENVSFFHRLFAAVYGKSPKQYRKDL